MSNPVSRGVPSCFVAQPADDVAQRAVVDVEHALPGHAVRVEPQRVPVVDVVVDHGGQEVVGGRHRVQVARQMQVQVLERDDLAVAAAGRAALDPEGGAHGGLADGDGRLPPDAGQGLTEADRRGGLALAERRGGHGGHDDVAGTGAVGQGLDGVEADLGDVRAVGLEQPGSDAHLRRDVGRSGAAWPAARSRWPEEEAPAGIMPDGPEGTPLQERLAGRAASGLPSRESARQRRCAGPTPVARKGALPCRRPMASSSTSGPTPARSTPAPTTTSSRTSTRWVPWAPTTPR